MSNTVTCPYCDSENWELYELHLDDWDSTTTECSECWFQINISCRITYDYRVSSVSWEKEKYQKQVEEESAY